MLRREEKEKLPEASDITSFLGKGSEFKGILTYEGTIRVDGRVEGEIITKGTLFVGEGAEVQADVTAGTVVSSGTIRGNVMASEKVHLLPSSAVIGKISTPVLIIEEGVQFNGTCEMGRKEVFVRGDAVGLENAVNRKDAVGQRR